MTEMFHHLQLRTRVKYSMIGICSTAEVKYTHLAEVGVLQWWVSLLSVCLHGVLQD